MRLPSRVTLMDSRGYTAKQMREYAKKAVLLEREACAKVCIEMGKKFPIGFREFDCADAIRARGEA